MKDPSGRTGSAIRRAWQRRRRPPEPPALIRTPRPSLTYRLISYLLVFPIYRLLYRGRTAGNTNVPHEGALVVVANHGSHLDPPLLGHALGRPVAFMAKAELFRVPILGPIIRACGAYPVARGASDREAIRTATDRLLQGWATGVFIDGTRQSNGRVNNPQAGAALLAARVFPDEQRIARHAIALPEDAPSGGLHPARLEFELRRELLHSLVQRTEILSTHRSAQHPQG